MEKFSTNPKDSWLHIRSKGGTPKPDEMKNDKSTLYIIPTGWINCK